MKITIRLIVSLTLVVALVAVGSSFHQVRKERLRLASDMDRRVSLLADSLRESVVPLVRSDSREKLDRLVERVDHRAERPALPFLSSGREFPRGGKAGRRLEAHRGETDLRLRFPPDP